MRYIGEEFHFVAVELLTLGLVDLRHAHLLFLAHADIEQPVAEIGYRTYYQQIQHICPS